MSFLSVPDVQLIVDSLYRMIPFVVLYPELHYVFRFFPFSRYRIRQPEIVTDIPCRLDPGKKLPVLLLVKDADRYPVNLHSINIRILTHPPSHYDFTVEMNLNDPWWHRIFYIDVPDQFRGQTIEISAEVTYTSGKKLLSACQDNFPGMRHRPYSVYIADEALPCPGNWVMGDMHIHSHYTSDQVEFGAPLSATAELAKAMGLSFAAVTDHSYDLDDDETNYLKRDPELRKWNKLQNDIRDINSGDDSFILIPGEEVTCRNSQQRNVHCLVLNHPEYIPGSGDGAEKWLKTRSEKAITDLPGLVSDDALVIAAHPMEPVPALQRRLINRGNWNAADCETPGLHGLQILNGNRSEAFFSGLSQWISQLLKGQRLFIFAGNDAHGNFNRFRQVRLPMISLSEIDHFQIFGNAKTCVMTGERHLSVDGLLEGLRLGRAIITDGPFMAFTVSNDQSGRVTIGGDIRGNVLRINLESVSTAEFGCIESIRLYLGVINGEEKLIADYQPRSYGFDSQVRLSDVTSAYIRAELETAEGHYCYTNPVWVTG